MLGLTKSTFSQFMGAGRETTGKGSPAYLLIINFLNSKKKRRIRSYLHQRSACLIENSSHDIVNSAKNDSQIKENADIDQDLVGAELMRYTDDDVEILVITPPLPPA
jgi:hypothetical protein